MAKRTGIVVLTLAGLLCSCGGASSSLTRETEESISEPSSSVSSSSGESSTSSSSSSEAEVCVQDLGDDLSQLLPLYMKKLSSFSTYKAVTKGKTVSKVLFIDVEQSIDVTSIKGDYSYLKNESHSDFVNTVHEAYFHDGNALVKNLNDAKFAKQTMDEYLNVYGVDPYGYNIEGYKIAGNAVKSIARDQTDDHLFRIAFDPVEATNNVRIQMKVFGGLDEYPTFSSIEIAVKLQDDFAPVSYQVHATYHAKRTMDTDCVQDYTVTFSNFNETIEIPNLGEIRSEYGF